MKLWSRVLVLPEIGFYGVPLHTLKHYLCADERNMAIDFPYATINTQWPPEQASNTQHVMLMLHETLLYRSRVVCSALLSQSVSARWGVVREFCTPDTYFDRFASRKPVPEPQRFPPSLPSPMCCRCPADAERTDVFVPIAPRAYNQLH
jgi:hypothetical protein